MGGVAESGLGARSLGVVADPDIVEVDSDILATVQVLIVVGALHIWFGFVGGRRPSVAGCTFVARGRQAWFLRGSCGWWLRDRGRWRRQELMGLLEDRGGRPSGQRAQTEVDWRARWHCSAGPCGNIRPTFCGCVGGMGCGKTREASIRAESAD